MAKATAATLDPPLNLSQRSEMALWIALLTRRDGRLSAKLSIAAIVVSFVLSVVLFALFSGKEHIETVSVVPGRRDLVVQVPDNGVLLADDVFDQAAGGVVLVREAGGQISNADGSALDPYTPDAVASNGPLHPVMLEALRTGP